MLRDGLLDAARIEQPRAGPFDVGEHRIQLTAVGDGEREMVQSDSPEPSTNAV